MTGAGSGIGRATAIALAQRGWSVALAGRRREPLDAVAHEIAAGGGTAHVLTGDIGVAREARAMVVAAADALGALDALINNAGLAPLMPIPEHDEQTIADVFNVNAVGPANAIAAAWPIFARQRRAVIVNVSSAASTDPFPGFFAYAAAKAAVNLLARSAAKEGARLGIRAFAVAPGAVETPMLRAIFDARAVPPQACLTPEAVAAVILDCIEGRRDAENGATIAVSTPRA